MDAGKLSICGEESFGTGSDHIREKDGLWAILAWLNIMAVTKQKVGDILKAHWEEYGRVLYKRYDYEEVDSEAAKKTLSTIMGLKVGAEAAGHQLANLDEFSYVDPVDGNKSTNQGLQLFFKDGSRAVVRLSGTGSSGATIRVYLEGPDSLATAILELSRIAEITGRSQPSVIT